MPRPKAELICPFMEFSREKFHEFHRGLGQMPREFVSFEVVRIGIISW
jgi:hypothetical protein